MEADGSGTERYLPTEYGLKLKKAKSIMQPYHTDKNPTPPLCIVGKFDAVN
jgi:hypothetical protein